MSNKKVTDKLFPKINKYIFEEKIFTPLPNNELSIMNVINSWNRTVIIYKTDLYEKFSEYSKKDIDYCIEIFNNTFHPVSQSSYLIHGVKKVKFKNKKGWFS